MTTATSTISPVLSAAAALDLSAYREEHVTDRIRRAVEREGVSGVGGLVRLLRADVEARARFRRSVAVSFSGPFRDPAQFELLERELLPELLAGTRRLRVWSAGCADGSELYSTAIVLERLGALDRAFLLGSDLLEENLAAARRGLFDGAPLSDALRAHTRWEQRDLVSDGAPPGRWHLILCRNVAIYLSAPAKEALHELLAAALAPGGLLMLGRSERLTDPAAFGLERAVAHAYRKAA